MLMAVSCRLHLYLSPRNKLSSPTETSNRCRAAMRGGFLSSFSVPGAGIEIRVDPYWAGAHVVSGALSVGRTFPQNNPACNCSSALNPDRSTGVVVSVAKGTAPATRPLSYRQLKPI